MFSVSSTPVAATPVNNAANKPSNFDVSPVSITALFDAESSFIEEKIERFVAVASKPPPSPSLAALKHLEELHTRLANLQNNPTDAQGAISDALEQVHGLADQVEKLHEQACSWQQQLDDLLEATTDEAVAAPCDSAGLREAAEAVAIGAQAEAAAAKAEALAASTRADEAMISMHRAEESASASAAAVQTLRERVRALESEKADAWERPPCTDAFSQTDATSTREAASQGLMPIMTTRSTQVREAKPARVGVMCQAGVGLSGYRTSGVQAAAESSDCGMQAGCAVNELRDAGAQVAEADANGQRVLASRQRRSAFSEREQHAVDSLRDAGGGHAGPAKADADFRGRPAGGLQCLLACGGRQPSFGFAHGFGRTGVGVVHRARHAV